MKTQIKEEGEREIKEDRDETTKMHFLNECIHSSFKLPLILCNIYQLSVT